MVFMALRVYSKQMFATSEALTYFEQCSNVFVISFLNYKLKAKFLF